jgi:hypothetical protein
MRLPSLIIVVTSSLLNACASTGATFDSGVGDRLIDRPPFYAGAAIAVLSADTSTIGHLPIAFQAGASQPAMFDPRSGRGTPMDRLLDEMNAYLDSLGVTKAMGAGPATSVLAMPSNAVAPDVRFGCRPLHAATDEECAPPIHVALGRGRQEHLLAVGRPSPSWIEWHGSVRGASGVARTLVITLEVGQYWMRQEGLLGNKRLELGTGNTASLPWLTSLETPILVLQMTAALVDANGRAIRIGAEGFLPKRTRFWVSALSAQELLTDDDVAAVRAQRRDDLPGTPLAWQVAMRTLVAQVTGREVR